MDIKGGESAVMRLASPCLPPPSQLLLICTEGKETTKKGPLLLLCESCVLKGRRGF